MAYIFIPLAVLFLAVAVGLWRLGGTEAIELDIRKFIRFEQDPNRPAYPTPKQQNTEITLLKVAIELLLDERLMLIGHELQETTRILKELSTHTQEVSRYQRALSNRNRDLIRDNESRESRLRQSEINSNLVGRGVLGDLNRTDEISKVYQVHTQMTNGFFERMSGELMRATESAEANLHKIQSETLAVQGELRTTPLVLLTQQDTGFLENLERKYLASSGNAMEDKVRRPTLPRSVQYVGIATLPKKAYISEGQNLTLILERKPPALLSSADTPANQPEASEEPVTLYIDEQESAELFLEVEIQGAALTIAGDKKQRQSLGQGMLAFRWNGAFQNSGNQAFSLILRVSSPITSYDIGAIERRIRVRKVDGLTEGQITLVGWVAGIAGTISTILSILTALHLFGLH